MRARKPAAPKPDPEIERKAHAIEPLLTAPCCYKGTLVDHASAIADQMRRQIRVLLRQGKSKDEVLAYFKKKYGQAVLATPPKTGLSRLVLYGVPFGLAFLGLLLTTIFLARRRGHQEQDDDLGLLPQDHEIPKPLAAQVDALIDAARRRQAGYGAPAPDGREIGA